MEEQQRGGGSSRRQGREFGLMVGLAFAGLGAWWSTRGRLGWGAVALLGLAGLLVLLGLIWPRALVVPRRGWMAAAEGLGSVVGVAMLGVVFFFVILPIGVAKRLAGWDPFGRRVPPGGTFWRPYLGRRRGVRHYERLF